MAEISAATPSKPPERERVGVSELGAAALCEGDGASGGS